MAGQRLSERITAVAAVYYNPDFLDTLEYHIPRLSVHPDGSMIVIEPALANQYHGDLYGLLSAVGVPRQYQWTIMRVNGMRSPTDYDVSMVQLIQPPYREIDDLQRIWSSSNNLLMG